jgi:uncharacterized protein (TIGR00162 family)
VGKLAAEHLLEQVKAKKFAEIYSKFFPPQVLLDDDGVIRLVNNQLYYSKGDGTRPDIIFLTGDYQGLTPEGQYELSDYILQLSKKWNVKLIFTLGGYGIGKMIEKPRVLGAATDLELVEEMKKKGVIFSRVSQAAASSGPQAASRIGKIEGMKAVCLMGETRYRRPWEPKRSSGCWRASSTSRSISAVEKAEQIDLITSKLKEREPQEPKRGPRLYRLSFPLSHG